MKVKPTVNDLNNFMKNRAIAKSGDLRSALSKVKNSTAIRRVNLVRIYCPLTRGSGHVLRNYPPDFNR